MEKTKGQELADLLISKNRIETVLTTLITQLLAHDEKESGIPLDFVAKIVSSLMNKVVERIPIDEHTTKVGLFYDKQFESKELSILLAFFESKVGTKFTDLTKDIEYIKHTNEFSKNNEKIVKGVLRELTLAMHLGPALGEDLFDLPGIDD